MMNISVKPSLSLIGLEYHALNDYTILAFNSTKHYLCMDIIAPVQNVQYGFSQKIALPAYSLWKTVHVFWDHI